MDLIETLNDFFDGDILKINYDEVKEEIKQYKSMMKYKFKFGKYKDCLIYRKIEEDLDYCLWFYGICYNKKLNEFIRLYILKFYYPIVKDLY